MNHSPRVEIQLTSATRRVGNWNPTAVLLFIFSYESISGLPGLLSLVYTNHIAMVVSSDFLGVTSHHAWFFSS